MNSDFTFDQAVFDRLGAELGAANTAEVLNVFLEDTADRLARLESGELTDSARKREFHSIKSSAATFGFEDLSRLAIELESGSDAMEHTTLADGICELRHAYESSRQFALKHLTNPAFEEVSR